MKRAQNGAVSEPPSRTPVEVAVSAHDVVVRIRGVLRLILRRSDILGVQGFIKNIGPAKPIHFVETTTSGGPIVSDYEDRALWAEVLTAIEAARLFDERLGEAER